MDIKEQSPAQFYPKKGNLTPGREIRAIGNSNDLGSIELFSDVVLKQTERSSNWFSESGNVLILPLFGALEVRENNKTGFIHINQIATFPVKAGTKMEFKNVYPDDSIRFIMIFRKGEAVKRPQTENYTFSSVNRLQQIYKDTFSILNLGQFTGRTEAAYTRSKPDKSFFVYVIQGAFEVEERLLEAGEAIYLWDQKELELEALSNNAYLLVLEF